MWKYVKFVSGILLILMSFASLSSLFSGQVEETGRRIVENGVTVDGFITERVEHTVAAKRGRIGGIGRYYTIKYKFTTLDGKTYSDEINVTKKEAYDAEDGERIKVRYYSKNPEINSALGYEEYMTEADAADVPVGAFVFSALLFFCGGAWLTYSSSRRIWPEQTSANQSALERMRRESSDGMPSSPEPIAGYVKKDRGEKPLFGG